MHKIPVILDTDIGGDIDDTWALAMLLQSPELDLKLVVTDTGDTTYRARIAARLLEVAGRTDVPVGIGIPTEGHAQPQLPWVADYPLERYPGKVYQDGVQALIDTILGSAEPIMLICIGPVPNIGAALRREPGIAAKCRFVGMHGSLRSHHDGGQGPIAEYNVVTDVPACQQVFTAPWIDMTITPLDTCGQVRLQGAKYEAVSDSPNPLARAVIENYRIWLQAGGWPEDERSSILFDTVAIHLAYSTRYLKMETLGVRVTDEGYTVIDPTARPVQCAVEWADLDAYEDFLVSRLTVGL